MTKDDLFTVLYKSKTQNYMFSGEVHDAVKPYIVSTLTDYYEVSSYILASLNAQKKLLSADFDASRINDPNLRKQYESFRNAESTIDDMIIYVQKSMNARQLSVNIAGTPRRFNKTVGALLFAVLMPVSEQDRGRGMLYPRKVFQTAVHDRTHFSCLHLEILAGLCYNMPAGLQRLTKPAILLKEGMHDVIKFFIRSDRGRTPYRFLPYRRFLCAAGRILVYDARCEKAA